MDWILEPSNVEDFTFLLYILMYYSYYFVGKLRPMLFKIEFRKTEVSLLVFPFLKQVIQTLLRYL